MSNTRIAYSSIAPEALKPLLSLGAHVRRSGLSPALVHLIDARVSQINGCAYCVDMHTKDARAAGETEQRLYALAVWRETPFFSDVERAALAWAEAVTELGREGVPDAVYAEARKHFDERALVDLTLAVATINAWNRIAISFRFEAGTYQVAAR